MNCGTTAKSLVRFHDTMIKYDYFPSRQLELLDVIIEKGNKTNKPRVTQITETDFQLLMRIFKIENRRKL